MSTLPEILAVIAYIAVGLMAPRLNASDKQVFRGRAPASGSQPHTETSSVFLADLEPLPHGGSRTRLTKEELRGLQRHFSGTVGTKV